MLRESELAWLTHYVQALNALEPPLPLRVAISGQRAEGSVLDAGVSITVVADEHHHSSVEPRLKQIAAASDCVPSVPVTLSVVSPKAWERQQASNASQSHCNIWLAPHAAP